MSNRQFSGIQLARCLFVVLVPIGPVRQGSAFEPHPVGPHLTLLSVPFVRCPLIMVPLVLVPICPVPNCSVSTCPGAHLSCCLFVLMLICPGANLSWCPFVPKSSRRIVQNRFIWVPKCPGPTYPRAHFSSAH